MSERRTFRRRFGEERAEPTIVIKSRVDKIYDVMLEALQGGSDLETVLDTYIPLLLNELDKLLFMYPNIAPDLLIDTVETLWSRQFPEIPLPPIDRSDSAHTVFSKVQETLRRYVDKLPSRRSGVRTREEEEKISRYYTLRFMDVVCSVVFSMMGISL